MKITIADRREDHTGKVFYNRDGIPDMVDSETMQAQFAECMRLRELLPLSLRSKVELVRVHSRYMTAFVEVVIQLNDHEVKTQTSIGNNLQTPGALAKRVLADIYGTLRSEKDLTVHQAKALDEIIAECVTKIA